MVDDAEASTAEANFFNKCKIFNTADINKWLASQKMTKRVESLAIGDG